ncbi:MAG: alcohol dehydrogenase catalytic domain-containing protein [Deltaproteobacteria bacterium]|nr:alcohol dehydrogenase catalytic domain-containing protein [Deltaproteobacteria bacterium]NND28176.1 alcohol dehydrogenase catalytic domain-containing protein [Myxococcales bacterium]MBT8464398.1 alcohol dehydrogenase catalytic domain-containing protein [Deltaproteobacteria bacterium]MBT8480351.1 alcohol dehydrogenase catalytic domain-containing protein [Deltaproteobacteria bacterium]NNK08195.1 alcohol dehydrogenase catalytic domain-containing protein [Myxococcales bacterium]
MNAVTFDVTIPSFLIGKSLGAVTEAAIFGGLSRVRYREVEEPALPGDDWVRLDVLEAGICGTDVGTLTFQASPILEPFGSLPAVLGHEVLARVSEVGPAVRRVEPGQRVAVDPMISCTMRGFTGEAQCGSCASGRHCTCARMGDEGRLRVSGKAFQPGMTVGYHNSLPGGWGERMIAHESQLFVVDDALSNRTAALIEPLSIGMHAALNVRPFGAGPALVIGSGPIALGLIWSLRTAGYQGELIAQVKRHHEADIAKSLGASLVVSPGDEARQALVHTGARGYRPIVGDEVYAGGGFPLIFDCVGSGQSLSQCLRYAAPRAQIVMLGCAAEIPKLDLSLLWARELEVKGFLGYGREKWRGEGPHTFQITHDMLVETGAPVEAMVTHVFPLAKYRDALSAAANRRRSGSIKVLMEPVA